MPGIQFTSYIPTALVGNNSPSPTLAAEVVTGLPIPTGAFPGNCFFLSESQASQLSQSVVNAAFPAFTCHAGWYMVVQVSAAAVAANVKAGAIGAVINVPTTYAAEIAGVPPQSVVTDGATAATAGLLGNYPVVFLNSVTPGNYTIVQVAGDATVLLAASQTLLAGQVAISLLTSQTPGTVIVAAANTSRSVNDVGIAQQFFNTPAGALTLTAAAAASGGSTVYTGTITGGGTNNFAGQLFTIAGFDLGANNGTFLCTANSTTTLTLSNANGVADTHAGTATALNLIRANVSFPFGIV
jgi:hypothetical protein